MKYISKKDILTKGLIKKNGRIYKQSLLEQWYSKGWLELNNSPYSSEERLYHGMRLAHNYHIANRANLHSGFILNSRVDLGKSTESLGVLTAKDNYYRAVKAVPREFWPIVRQICIDEQLPKLPSSTGERQRTYFYYVCRIDLCRGLDRIIDEYTHRLKV